MCSGNAIFQLEPVQIEWSGMSTEFEARVRLRHLTSNLYLAGCSLSTAAGADDPSPTLDERPVQSPKGLLQLCLSADYNSPSCVWQLHAFSKGGEAHLEEESFAFVGHAQGQWLAQGRMINSLNDAEDDKDIDGDEIQETFEAELKGQRLERNVMAISAIDPRYVEKLMNVRSSLAIIEAFAGQLVSDVGPLGVSKMSPYEDIKEAATRCGLVHLFASKRASVFSTLHEMVKMVTDAYYDGCDAKRSVQTYQVLSRETRLIDAVLCCLKAVDFPVFFGPAKDSSIGNTIIEFGTVCNTFLQAVCRANAMNQAYLSSHIGLFKHHLGGPIKVADTLAAIYENNMEQIQVVSEDVVAAFVALIRKVGRRPRFVNFLRTICGSPDRPVPKNQNWLVSHLFSDPGAIFFAAGPGQNGSTWILKTPQEAPGAGGANVDCSSFLGSLDDITKPTIFEWDRSYDTIRNQPRHIAFIYYICSLHLLCALCYGRNAHALEVVQKVSRTHGLGLEFEHLNRIVASDRLPYVLRCAALDLIACIHVNIDPRQPIQLPRLTRLLTQDSSTNPKTDSAKVVQRGPLSDLTSILVGIVGTVATTVSSQAAKDNPGGGHRARRASLIHAKGANPEDTGNCRIEEDWSCVGSHSLLLTVVSTLQMMFNLGVIDLDHPDVGPLLQSLLAMLTCLDCKDLQDASRFQHSAEADVVVKVKRSILALFEFALDMHGEMMLEAVFRVFARLHNEDRGVEVEPPGEGQSDDLEGFEELDGEDFGEKETPTKRALLPRSSSKRKIAPQNPKGHTNVKSAVRDLVRTIHGSAPHGFLMFKFDPLQYGKMEGPVMDLLGLVLYESPPLVSAAFRLIERLLSKRRKFLSAVMDTHIIFEEDMILMYKRCQALVADLHANQKWVASVNEDRKQDAISKCKEGIEELTHMLTPNQIVCISDGASERRIAVTKAKATNYQAILHDLRVHDLVMTFLKLPLRRRKQEPLEEGGRPRMDVAEDVPRRELFGLCYKFLKHFCVVCAPSSTAPNSKNQAAVCEHLGLFVSHTGVMNLNVADTIASLFEKNESLCHRIGAEILRKFVHMIVTYGEKKRARWLRFLQAIVVVDGRPVKENQSTVLSLASHYESDFCSFFNSGAAAQSRRIQLLQQEEHLANREDGPSAQGSELSYHRACIELLADCCVGKDTTFVVKASGFLTFEGVLQSLLLYGAPGVRPQCLRFVLAAYWKFLRHVYFATHTGSTRRSVRAANNGVWQADATQIARTSSIGSDKSGLSMWANDAVKLGSCSCLMEGVVKELRVALDEPKGALQDPESATAFLPSVVFPALQEYFQNHYLQHTTHLSQGHESLLAELAQGLRVYFEGLASLDAAALGMKQEKREAVASAKSLLETLSSVTGVLGMGDVQVALVNDEASQHRTTASAAAMQVVSSQWASFYTLLGRQLGVHVCEASNEPVEERTFLDCRVRYASLFLFAQMLAQPWATPVPNASPPLFLEQVVARLAHLLAGGLEALDWPDELVVKAVRCVRAAVHIDDGAGGVETWKAAWPRVVANEAPQSEHGDILAWSQSKYNRLGATRAAVMLVGHARVHVQLEAIRLLIALLEGGNGEVQDTMHGLLSVGGEASVAFFATMRAAFQRCSATAKDSASRRPQGTEEDRVHVLGTPEDEAEQDEEGDEEEVWEQRAVALNDADDDLAFTMEALRCLQLMAEGHHAANQQLLNAQPRNPINQDLLSEAVALLASVQSCIMESVAAGNRDNPALMVRLFEFLRELVQGPCMSNQTVMAIQTGFLFVSNRIFGYMDYDLQGRREKEEQAVQKCTIKANLLSLMYSLLEGATDMDIAMRIIDVVDMKTIQHQTQSLFSVLGFDGRPPLFRTKYVNDLLKTELLQFVFFQEKLNALLSADGKRSAESGAPLCSSAGGALKGLSKFIEGNLGSVEVMWGGRLEKGYFPLTPTCQSLATSGIWKSNTLEILRSISPDSRSNPALKAIELAKAMEKIVNDIDIESSFITGSGGWLLPLMKRRRLLQEGAAYISIVVIAVMACTYGASHGEWEGGREWAVVGTRVLSVVELALMGAVALIFYVSDFPKWAEEMRKQEAEGANGESLEDSSGQGGDESGRSNDGAPNDSCKGGCQAGGIKPPPDVSSTQHERFRLLKKAKTLFTYWKTWYILLLLAASVGAVVHSPFCLTFHLTFFFVEFEAGKMIIEALSKSGTAILRTAVLAILSILIFAVLSFTLFREPLAGQAPPCSTFYQCTGSHFIAGIYGDIAGLFTGDLASDVPDDVGSSWKLQLRSIFVVVFFMMWTFVLSNIFTGLIADAFGAIRDDKNTVQTDSDSRCLVCSLERFAFDSAGNGFDDHVAHDHCPLDYVYYLHYLRHTVPDEYTGYDSCVAAAMAGSETDKAAWLPIGRALVLEHVGGGEGGERQRISEGMERLWGGLKAIEGRLRELEERSRGPGAL
eukprot:evm.model.scf_406EXC.4 EVM.evm.TU.scf_406EXC.4   scf_406EXC:46870-60636(-)